MRVTDDTVRSFLVWARNYGEITSFEKLPGGGRCWKITLPAGLWAHAADGPLLGMRDPEREVPTEFVLTAREALAFGYGVAVGGAAERRADVAARRWGWGDPASPATTTSDLEVSSS